MFDPTTGFWDHDAHQRNTRVTFEGANYSLAQAIVAYRLFRAANLYDLTGETRARVAAFYKAIVRADRAAKGLPAPVSRPVRGGDGGRFDDLLERSKRRDMLRVRDEAFVHGGDAA